MSDAVSLVTVIVPAREEAGDIEGCLDAIARQDYPVSHLEVIVVDADSNDRTADLARGVLSRCGFASSVVLSNPRGTAPSNLNAGLARASGQIVCRVDARTRIQRHYVRTCVELLTSRPELAVVGGAQVAIPRDRTAAAVGIARALNNRWSMGGSTYRRSATSGPSDTVYLGAFRRTELLEEGGWEEALVSNQDFDLNRRMSRRGTVWFESSLRSGYLPRHSIRLLWRQYLRFGRAKVTYWSQPGKRPETRQWVLLVGPPVAIAAAAAVIAGAGRSPARLLGIFVAAVVGVGTLETQGADEPRGGIASHALAVIVMGVVSAGWWWGVVSSGLTNRR